MIERIICGSNESESLLIGCRCLGNNHLFTRDVKPIHSEWRRLRIHYGSGGHEVNGEGLEATISYSLENGCKYRRVFDVEGDRLKTRNCLHERGKESRCFCFKYILYSRDFMIDYDLPCVLLQEMMAGWGHQSLNSLLPPAIILLKRRGYRLEKDPLADWGERTTCKRQVTADRDAMWIRYHLSNPPKQLGWKAKQMGAVVLVRSVVGNGDCGGSMD